MSMLYNLKPVCAYCKVGNPVEVILFKMKNQFCLMFTVCSFQALENVHIPRPTTENIAKYNFIMCTVVHSECHSSE